MRPLFTLAAFVLIGIAGKAQTKISGSVRDDQGKALSSANISLLKASDSSLIKVAIANQSGQYEFVNIKDGQYVLAATSVG